MSNSANVIQASAARFLIDGGEEDAANIFLSCIMEINGSSEEYFSLTSEDVFSPVRIKLTGPRAAYDILTNQDHPITRQIQNAIRAVWSDGYQSIEGFSAYAEQIEIDPDWRSELLEIARGKGVHNQAAGAKNSRTWQNLNFRSQSEIKIAVALDKTTALFLPNCKVRLNIASSRENREADFLICMDGRWGILEVDGEPFHPPSRTVADHERDRLFRAHGIKVVEHYDATRCYNSPDEVVQDFFSILSKS